MREEQHTPVPSSPPSHRDYMEEHYMEEHAEKTGPHYAMGADGRVLRDPHTHQPVPESTAERALRIARETRLRIGEFPRPHEGFEGTGLAKNIARTEDKVDKVLAVVTTNEATAKKWYGRAGTFSFEVIKAAIPLLLAFVGFLIAHHVALK